MEEDKKVTQAKIANEEYLLKARKEIDELHKRKLNAEFAVMLNDEKSKATMWYELNYAAFLKDHGPDHTILITLKRLYDEKLSVLYRWTK